MKIIFAIVAAQLIAAGGALAQMPARVDSISAEGFVEEAIAANPLIRAARIRVEAARARASTSGLRPDPTVMAGLLNVPVRGAPFKDLLTMKNHSTLELSRKAQSLELKVPLKRRIARAVSNSHVSEAGVLRTPCIHCVNTRLPV